MTPFRCLSFAVALLLVSVGSAVEAQQNWDFLLLVQQWGQAFCATQRQDCQVPAGTTWFTLHGLWPNNNDTTYPSNCGGAPFNQGAIQSIVGQLNKYWTNYLVDTTSASFWAHEYNKHGTCATSLPALGNELKFFSGALNIRNLYDATQALASAGITPSNSNPYTAAQIKAAIRATYGVDPLLACSFSNNLQEDVLVEVAFCIGKNRRAFECDPRIYAKGIGRKCDSSIYYLRSSSY